MRDRRFRPALFVFGVAFITVGIAYLAGGHDAFESFIHIVAPTSLMATGVLVLLTRGHSR